MEKSYAAYVNIIIYVKRKLERSTFPMVQNAQNIQ